MSTAPTAPTAGFARAWVSASPATPTSACGASPTRSSRTGPIQRPPPWPACTTPATWASSSPLGPSASLRRLQRTAGSAQPAAPGEGERPGQPQTRHLPHPRHRQARPLSGGGASLLGGDAATSIRRSGRAARQISASRTPSSSPAAWRKGTLDGYTSERHPVGRRWITLERAAAGRGPVQSTRWVIPKSATWRFRTVGNTARPAAADDENGWRGCGSRPPFRRWRPGGSAWRLASGPSWWELLGRATATMRAKSMPTQAPISAMVKPIGGQPFALAQPPIPNFPAPPGVPAGSRPPPPAAAPIKAAKPRVAKAARPA